MSRSSVCEVRVECADRGMGRVSDSAEMSQDVQVHSVLNRTDNPLFTTAWMVKNELLLQQMYFVALSDLFSTQTANSLSKIKYFTRESLRTVRSARKWISWLYDGYFFI